MTILKYLISNFKENYNGSPWYGQSYKEIIGDITPEEALAMPPDGHNIARLLWHTIKWRIALTERLKGNMDFRASDTDNDNWREAETLDTASWEEAKRQYDALQTLLISELEKREEAFLDEEWFPNRNFELLIRGVLHHDLYHLGQISLIKGYVRRHGIWR